MATDHLPLSRVDPLYRTTFLRWHVPEQLRETAEVRPVDDLIKDLASRGRELTPVERDGLLTRFFDVEEETKRLYLPLVLRPDFRGPRDLPREYLTSLTEYLRRPVRGNRPGVLLSARSGAGKTLACIKAFRDCVVTVPGESQPRLAGRLPVRLRLTDSPHQGTRLHALRAKADGNDRDRQKALSEARAISSPRIIEELLLAVARCPDWPHERMGEWLRHSPPLLLFVDLNATDSDVVRLAVAQALRHFQKDYAGVGHRCIVSYRSTEEGDDAMAALHAKEPGAEELFRSFDLEAVDEKAALEYLTNLRAFQKAVYPKHGLDHPALREDERRMLEDFLRRFTCNRESLISTPLVMHFVSMLPPADVWQLHSLADLYHRVVQRMLDRQGLESENDRRSAHIAMVRVALAILARGGRGTIFEGRNAFKELMGEPGDTRGEGCPWQPDDRYWLDSNEAKGHPYYREGIADAIRLRERALFAANQIAIGFLHDSFLYYFAAYALRYHKGPLRPSAGIDRDVWPDKVFARIWPQRAAWELSLEFLGGMLTVKELQKLVVLFLVADPVPDLVRLLLRLLRGRRMAPLPGDNSAPVRIDDPILNRLEAVARARAPDLSRCPRALFAQAYHGLAWCEETPGSASGFAKEILWPEMQRAGRPWLRAETPLPVSTVQVLRCHAMPLCLELSVSGELLAGYDDGWVRRWILQTGERHELYRSHASPIAIDSKEGVIRSVHQDGTIRGWIEGGEEAEVLFTHALPVAAAAFHLEGDSAVFADHCCRVWRWSPNTGSPSLLFEHPNVVTALALDSEHRSIVFGDVDRNVLEWHERTSSVSFRYRQAREFNHVTAVATAGTMRVIVSGGRDGYLATWHREGAPISVQRLNDSTVRSIVIDTREGEIFTAGREGIWRGPFNAARVPVRLERIDGEGVSAVAIDPVSGMVLAGGSEGQVWQLRGAGSEAVELYRHPVPVEVKALCGTGDGVVSVGSDGTVLRWRAEEGLTTTLTKIRNQVSGLGPAANDGKVTVVWSEGANHLISWSEGGSEDFLGWIENDAVTSFAVGSGCVIYGGALGKVQMIRAGTLKGEELYRHEDSVTALATDDHIVLSGGFDYCLRLDRIGRSDPLFLLIDFPVRSLAVSRRHNRIAVASDAGLVLLRVEQAEDAAMAFLVGPESNEHPRQD